MFNPYIVLEVSNDAPIDECKKAYRRLCAKYHPDNNLTGDREKFDQVQKAWGMIEKGLFVTLEMPKSRSLTHGSLFEFTVVLE